LRDLIAGDGEKTGRRDSAMLLIEYPMAIHFPKFFARSPHFFTIFPSRGAYIRRGIAKETENSPLLDS
jgi:hypothetical protein